MPAPASLELVAPEAASGKNAAARLDAIFRPRSIAIVGASARPDSLGRQILDNLQSFGFQGRVFPVNPAAARIDGLPCYPSVAAIEEPVDLGLLVVPRRAVLAAVEECIAQGVRGLVVITAGFRELDSEGARLEAELRRLAAAAEVPLVGPNCMGLFNTDPATRLNLTFSPRPPRRGPVAFLSQSGALGAAVLTLAESHRLGFSLFASLGNEAGVTHTDALAYAGEDENTRVVALYLETFEHPETFLRVAREVSTRKPIVCLKGGRTESGARAAASHTGALATSGRVFDAVMRQSGVIVVDSLPELLAVAQGFSCAPLPRGRRVRVLTNAGGPGVVTADWLARRRLELPPLAAEDESRFRSFLTPQAPVANPLDLTVEGSPEMFGRAARLLLDDPATDALLAIFVEPPRVAGPNVLAELEREAELSQKPVVGAFPAQEELRRQARYGKIPLIEFPETASVVVAALADYADWKRKADGGPQRRFPANRRQVGALLQRAQREKRTVLDVEESLRVLRAYGFPVARGVLVRSSGELRTSTRRLGFPLALKAVSARMIHKTERGGVKLDVRTAAELRKAYRELVALSPNEPLRGVLVQEMVRGGRELLLGFRRDAQGVGLLMAGLGGVYVEALDAVAARVLPVTEGDVREMLAEVPGRRILGEFRSQPAVSQDLLAEVLLRLAQLAGDFPAIAELDVNPFVVGGGRNAAAVDARIILQS
ncbi:MAG TPA: acetate--CoA ligase family protein [Candidatus Acidoferrales bacterium]